jgi:(1->4)-alpha-D-glucan 1-alpha-D-glucosylmutase
MAERTPLERLAERHGVGLEYFDIWGNVRRASPAALEALLAAMGVDARAEDRARAALPAALVVREDRQPATLPLRLPAALDGERLAWRVDEESGASLGGAFVPRDLPDRRRRALALERPLPCGYHDVAILRGAETLAASTLIVAPSTCFRPPALPDGARVWGAAAQLYAVRSERNWGIGDFTDLLTLIELWGARGAALVGVNPLHALFPHNPAHASPYSPSNRLFLNVLYLDVEAIADFAECAPARALVRSAPFAARLDTLRAAALVDYPGVATAKFEVLEALYACFAAHHLAHDTARARAFRAFQARSGEALRHHALFDALQERFHRRDPTVWGWPVWPEPFRDPDSPEVERFAVESRDRVEFFEYLQWQADLQLEAVARRARELGLGVGLYADLAVSIDRAGAEAWANQRLYAIAASVGAPPDDFNPRGQDWGLPPLVPERMRAAAYAPFIATLRANMRHAGALRIDHVMGLMRLFWVPPGGTPDGGTYVHYPLDDLLGILALESHRNRCLVIGEDLGTVPAELRRTLAAHGVLSYRVLLFERDAAGDFKPPDAYPSAALVTASTHDLPTLAGWWVGHDIALLAGLGLPVGGVPGERETARAQDRSRLLAARSRRAGPADPGAEMTPALARAVQCFLARSPAQVLVVQLEDVLGAREQVNLPATTGERHPNWRRKLTLALERWPEAPRFVELASALAAERPQPARPHRAPSAAAIIPRATYRVQLHRDFGFAQATALVPYLAALGVSHVYCSPYLRARPGSRHGYDIVDHAAVNPEIGSDEEFERFCAALARHGMGQILDMVPNHMAVMGADNAWWMDVLENGPASAYADWFDIDWAPNDADLAGKVLLPVLGDHYGEALERGELVLAYEADAGAFAIRYREHRFPVDPRAYPLVLERVAGFVERGTLAADVRADFEQLIAAFRNLPPRIHTAPAAIWARTRDKEAHKAGLARLVRAHPALAAATERALRRFNGTPGESASFDLLEALLEAQAYRLAYWRVAADEINYRRFFDVNDLAALRMENADAFEATHRFVLGLAAAGRIHACASIIRTDCTTRCATSGGCRSVMPSSPGSIARPSTRRARGHCTSWPRRSSHRTSGCRRAGPCTGPPATGSRAS